MKTLIREPGVLVKALADLGFASVEVHEIAQPLYGYQGDIRRETAEVIVRRKYVGRASNDIGFKKRADGTYDAVISSYDRAKYDDKWLSAVSHRYAYYAARDRLEQQGFELALEETRTDGQVHLILRRMT